MTLLSLRAPAADPQSSGSASAGNRSSPNAAAGHVFAELMQKLAEANAHRRNAAAGGNAGSPDATSAGAASQKRALTGNPGTSLPSANLADIVAAPSDSPIGVRDGEDGDDSDAAAADASDAAKESSNVILVAPVPVALPENAPADGSKAGTPSNGDPRPLPGEQGDKNRSDVASPADGRATAALARPARSVGEADANLGAESDGPKGGKQNSPIQGEWQDPASMASASGEGGAVDARQNDQSPHDQGADARSAAEQSAATQHFMKSFQDPSAVHEHVDADLSSHLDGAAAAKPSPEGEKATATASASHAHSSETGHVVAAASTVSSLTQSPTISQAVSVPQPAGRALVDEVDVSRQIVQAMRMQFRDGIGDARLTLKPDYLGEVSISLRVQQGVVTATLSADTASVRSWIESNEPMLRQGLAEQGLTLARLVVSAERSQEHDDGHERRAPQDQHREESARRRGRRGEQPAFELLM